MLTEQQFSEIHSRYVSSGLSIRSFCLNEGISKKYKIKYSGFIVTLSKKSNKLSIYIIFLYFHYICALK